MAGLESDSFHHYFQLQPKNMIVGEASRVKLLKAVGSSLLALPDVFGPDGRPGNLLGTHRKPFIVKKFNSDLLPQTT